MGLFREILDTWKEKETGETTRVGQKRLKQLKTRKDQLVEAFPYRQTIDQATYQQEKDKLDQEIALAEMAAHDAKLDMEAVVAFAEHMLMNAARLWHEFSLD